MVITAVCVEVLQARWLSAITARGTSIYSVLNRHSASKDSKAGVKKNGVTERFVKFAL